MEPRRPRLPRLVPGVELRSLPLTPLEGFVLSRIDGVATVQEIADLTNLDGDAVQQILTKLLDLGAVEWADGLVHLPTTSGLKKPSQPAPPRSVPTSAHSAPKSNVVEISPPEAPRQPRSAPPPSLAPSAESAPSEVEMSTATGEASGDGIDLTPERRRRIDELYPLLDLLNHYEVLRVPQNAEPNQIRAAYFELSKVFHPDTAFRRNLGPYKAKMEAIFKRLTEAYGVLGKKKSRLEYDAYLAAQGVTRRAEQAMNLQASAEDARGDPRSTDSGSPSAQASSAPPLASSAASPAIDSGGSPAAERAAPSAGRSEEAKRRARELVARRLEGLRRPSQPQMAATVGSSRRPSEVARDLAQSLKVAAALTGGGDLLERHIVDARRLEQGGDYAGALRALRLAVALDSSREDLRADHARISRLLAARLADHYRRQAEYEEKHGKWTAAALSWSKVVEGCPDDPEAMRRAALALVEARGDLHQAQRLAQRACDLRPNDPAARTVLGRVYLAAGLRLNAQRELERAAMLAPNDQIVKNLLREVKA